MMDLMIDLETMGLSVNAAIIQIGAAMFDPYSKATGGQFTRNISLQSSLFNGGVMDTSTVQWWLNQPRGTQMTTESSCFPIHEVLEDLSNFIEAFEPEYIWANGAADDLPWLKAAYENARKIVPWKHYQAQDTRTLYRLAAAGGWDKPRRGSVAHVALDDAIGQVIDVQSATAFLSSAFESRNRELNQFLSEIAEATESASSPGAAAPTPNPEQ